MTDKEAEVVRTATTTACSNYSASKMTPVFTSRLELIFICFSTLLGLHS